MALVPGVIYATIGGAIYEHIKADRRLKEKEQERSEAIVKEHFGEEVLGYIRVKRRVGSILDLDLSIIHEVLVITPNEVLVERIRTETPQLGELEVTVDHSHYEFAIPKSEIIKVELNKFLHRIKLNIHEQRFIHRGINIPSYIKKYKWWIVGLVPEQKNVKLEDYENILRQAFPDKMSARK